jgi:thiol-disulfide isomerase/thioredoxin
MSNKKRSSKGPGSPRATNQTASTSSEPVGSTGESSGPAQSRVGVQTKGVHATGSQRRASAKVTRLRRRRIRVGLFIAVAVVVLGGVASVVAQSGGSRAGGSRAGDNATSTAWVLPRLGQSGSVALSSLRGTPVVVNMFASWCTVCQSELPAFAAEARQLRGKITFVEVNSLETGDGLAMAQQFGLAAAGAIVLSDVGGAQHSGLHDALGGGNNMPVSAFYSASGKLLTSHVGGFSASTLQIQLRQLYGASA